MIKMSERIWMTEEQKKNVTRHIKKLCCNYNNGNCIALDDGDYVWCVQCHSYSLLCRWYINAVLPANPELEANVYGIVPKKRCAVCGKPIYSKSNFAKYCPVCFKNRRRMLDAERKQKARKNVRM